MNLFLPGNVTRRQDYSFYRNYYDHKSAPSAQKVFIRKEISGFKQNEISEQQKYEISSSTIIKYGGEAF